MPLAAQPIKASYDKLGCSWSIEEIRQMRSWRIEWTFSGQVRYWSLTSLNITQIISDKTFSFWTFSESSRAFYRAMLCICGTSHGPVSVSVCVSPSVSVTSRSSTKTAKSRITQTTPHDSPGTLVFWSQRSPRNSTGVTPYGGAKCRWGGSTSSTFDK